MKRMRNWWTRRRWQLLFIAIPVVAGAAMRNCWFNRTANSSRPIDLTTIITTSEWQDGREHLQFLQRKLLMKYWTKSIVYCRAAAWFKSIIHLHSHALAKTCHHKPFAMELWVIKNVACNVVYSLTIWFASESEENYMRDGDSRFFKTSIQLCWFAQKNYS